MQACFTLLLTTPPKPMVSPITSVAMLAATDKEVNWIGLYEGILRFQLRGKSLQLKLRNRVQTFFHRIQNFFPPFGLRLALLPSYSRHLFLHCCDQNRNFTAENCKLNAVHDLCLYAGMNCHKQKKYQDTSVSAGTKRLRSSLLDTFLRNSHRQHYHFSRMAFATAL